MKPYITATLFLASALLTASCSDNDDLAEGYFGLEGNPTGITVPAAGITKSKRTPITIRSNEQWTVAPANDEDAKWIHIFVNEGQDDGIFYYWVDANKNFTPRTGNLLFTVNGTPSPTLFRIDQEADVPAISIASADKGYEILPAGGQVKIAVSHNIDFTATLNPSSWGKIDSVGSDTVYVSATKNSDEARKATLTLTGTGEYANVTSSTVLSQAAAGVVMNEHFDWMQEGIEDFYYNYPEVRFDKWTADETAHGWTSLGDCMYGGRGYLKLGKTNDAGDLLSPKLAAISGKKDITLTFKAIGYVSKAGAKDDGVMRVMLVGNGSVKGESTTSMEVDGKTYEAATRQITVYPNSSLNENGADYNPWSEPAATFTVHFTGVTANTQLLFVGGTAWGKDLKGKGQGKNRLLIDDIKVVEE